MTTNDLIVAIELGSSKIAGAVGRKHTDGSLQVLAYASEPAAGVVRRGVVYNIDQTAQCLSNLINCLEPELGNATIEQVYVGVGGYTLHSERNTIARSFEGETRMVDAAMVDEMEEANAEKQYPGYGMLMMVSQEYKIGNNLQNNPVGVNCTQIEGNYLNILTRTSVMQNMTKSFDIAKINIADTAISPLAAANVLLTESERRQGCALVDFGADTTTVSVYKGGNLRFLTVIPMGSQNITRDLCSLQLDEEEAERIKREYGMVLPASSDETITLDDNRTIEARSVYDVIEARFEEIILNVCNQIEASGYNDKQLLAGVVCCGGGIDLKGFENALAKKAQMSKVRLAHKTITKVETVETHLRELSLNHTWADLAYLDTSAEQIGTHSLRDSVYSVLRGTVNSTILVWLSTSDRADVDDVTTLASLNHSTADNLCHIEKTLNVGVNHSIPIC